MYFYIINLFSIIVFMHLFKKDVRIMWSGCFLWLFILGAFRAEGIGADYYSYEQAYYLFLDKYTTSYEPLYVILNLICSKVGGYRSVIVSVSFLSLVGPVYYMIKNTKLPIVSMWFYITMGFYLWTYIIYRQAIAISFLLFAYEAAQKKKPLAFILFIFIASSFHKIAILAIIIYPVLNIKVIRDNLIYISTFTVFCTLVLREYSIFLLKSINGLFGERFSYYELKGANSGGTSLTIAYFCVFLFIFMLTVRQQKKMRRKNSNLLVFSFFMVVCQIIATVFPLTNRFGLFFAVPTFILLPNIVEENFTSGSKTACYFVLMSLSFAFFAFCLQDSAGNLVPYRLFSF